MLMVNVTNDHEGYTLTITYTGETEHVLMMILNEKYFYQTLSMVKNYYELNLISSFELWHICLKLFELIKSLDTLKAPTTVITFLPTSD